MATIRLQSSDGIVFETDVQTIKCSGTLSSMLANTLGEQGEESAINNVVPLAKVSSNLLDKILTWAHHHKDDLPQPTGGDDSNKSAENISDWDRQFIKMDKQEIFEMLLAADYLDIKGLLVLGTKVVANMMKGKSAEELRQEFGLKNDFTPEEEEHMRLQNDWYKDI